MPEFIHRFLSASSAGRPCTMLMLHGTGGTEDDLLPMARMLAPGAAILSPRGKVLENGQPRYFRRFAEGVFDTEDVEFRAHELADFVAASSARYGFDPGGVVAAGYSNGANIAAALLLLRPETLAAALLFRPMVPIQPPQPPDLRGKPVLISAGRRDRIVPPEDPKRLAELLGDAGAPVTLAWSETGHALEAKEIAAAREWLSSLSLASTGPAPVA